MGLSPESHLGKPWRYRLTLDGPAQAPGVFINLSSDNPKIADVPVAVPIAVGQVSADFVGLAGASFGGSDTIDVKIVAALRSDTSTATLHVTGEAK